ncbi:MAG: hypothetical protein EBZ77_09835 [Chitinophagia bacterium]|nr:hypothetical protein [Chitinophagia bacterium]
MAATDSYQFPVQGIANQISGWITSATTSNPITGGLTALAATISKDNGSFVSTTNAPVEIGTTGSFYVLLTSTECNCSTALVTVTASNSNAVYARFRLVFVAQDVNKLLKLNLNKQISGGTTIVTYENDNSTTAFTQQVSVTGTDQTGTFTRSAPY